MEDLEKDIQTKLVSLCKILPLHVEAWEIVLQEAQNPVKALSNFSEQLGYVEKADIKYMDNFSHVQQKLQCNISGHVEEELVSIRTQLAKLNKTNHDLKNKLSTLERATIDLDWNLDSPLLNGSPTQPPLNKILQMAYEFWIYFSNASKNINNKFKALNVRDQKSVKEFEQSLCLDLNKSEKETERRVFLILALTQYVINEKTVI